MKAEELRIGNYILDSTGRERIITGFTGISANQFSVWFNKAKSAPKHYGDVNKCKPIPLTEEWLVKFGFKNATGDRYGGYLSPTYGKEKCKLRIRKDDKGFSHQTNLLLLRIDYVHQLQNLYYALTGEELILNDK